MFYCIKSKKILKKIAPSYNLVISLFLLFFLMRPVFLYSDVIRLSSELTITQSANELFLSLRIINNGSYSAMDISVIIHFLKEIKISKKIEMLKKEESKTVQFTFIVPEDKVGAYPIIGEIKFHDINLFPFSYLHCTKIFIQTEEFSEKLKVKVNDINIHDQAKVFAQIKKNKYLDGIPIKASLFLSNAFDCKRDFFEFTSKKEQDQNIEFQVKNTNAIMNTENQGILVMTYLKDNKHHTALKTFKIHVCSYENKLKLFIKKFWLWGFAVITFFWILIVSIQIFILREARDAPDRS